MNPSLFVPEGAFEVLVRQQMARLLEPSLQCVNMVYEELRRLVLEIRLPELERYYKLQSRMHDVMESVLNDCLTPTNEMILNLIEIETSLINTNHPDFIGSADSLLNLFQEPEFLQKKSEADDAVTAGDTGDEGRSFSLLDKNQAAKADGKDEQGQEPGDEPVERKKTITDYLPNIFGRKQEA